MSPNWFFARYRGIRWIQVCHLRKFTPMGVVTTNGKFIHTSLTHDHKELLSTTLKMRLCVQEKSLKYSITYHV